MTKDQAIQHFGTQKALADALEISQGTVSLWLSVPPWRQLQIEQLTRGALRADADCDKYRGAPSAEPKAAA